ncbi:MAG: hypothetical protein LBQ03_02350 [Puniceicoccales bacterium]|nr:hypothetical protein [Puniceicoccales bacterium]
MNKKVGLCLLCIGFMGNIYSYTYKDCKDPEKMRQLALSISNSPLNFAFKIGLESVEQDLEAEGDFSEKCQLITNILLAFDVNVLNHGK